MKSQSVKVFQERPLISKADLRAPTPRHQVVVQWFEDVNLCKHYDGLGAICEQHGINVATLKPGQLVIFTNVKKTYAKVFAAYNVIASIRSKEQISLADISKIALAFRSGASTIDSQVIPAAIDMEIKRAVDLPPRAVEVEQKGRPPRRVYVRREGATMR